MRRRQRWAFAAAFLVALGVAAMPARAGGGYFVLGYGPYAAQTAGTSTAIGLDAFFGSSNPGKLSAVGTRADLGMLLFMPFRSIERTGSGTPFDFSTKSDNGIFYLPDGGYASRINDTWSWGVSVYGNGGLNTEYPGDTGVPGTNNNPAKCGNRPGNFFAGCGAVGVDIAQIIVAPTLSYAFNAQHSFGVAPLIGYQRFRAYGLQAFEALSQSPDNVTTRQDDHAMGAGLRVGWYGRILPWLDLGAAYATRIYMQKFDKYRGLLADSGSFDIPSNFSLGLALKGDDVTLGFDIQRVLFGEIPALHNGVLNSLNDPAGSPLGSKTGSGFNWRDQTNYRLSGEWRATSALALRAGVAYGELAQADHSVNTASLTMLAPNPKVNVTAGFSYAWTPSDELNFAYGRYAGGTYEGPSAVFQGATEKLSVRVDTLYFGWSRRW